jgi:hypothetical protein
MPSLLGSKPNQVSTNGELGTMAFREQEQFLALAGAQTVTGAKTFSEIITASKGVAFPATQVASADANTLDDYEEGTFTPTIKGSTTAGTASYSSQNGRYTKIGRTVQFELYVQWSSGDGTGNLLVEGLPFTSNAASTYPSFAIGYWDSVAITVGQVPMCFIGNSQTVISFSCMNAGGTGTGTVAYDVAGGLQISGCYTV